jgi:hypothetical protein
MAKRIIIEWFDAFVQKDDPERGADPDSGFCRGDHPPVRVFDSVAELDRALDLHSLPPLAKWEEHYEEPGQYHTQRSEDHTGLSITDDEYRADPERGLYLVDYTMRLSWATTRPLTAKDLADVL